MHIRQVPNSEPSRSHRMLEKKQFVYMTSFINLHIQLINLDDRILPANLGN
jgi:hypothetical protein